jgi:branched-chain amino acid transport system substrate-binding protein
MMKLFIVGISMLAVIVTTVSARADITIGVNLSTTGPAASLGIGQKNGILIGGPSVIAGQKVNYVFYDDATDTSNAVQNVKRLLSESKIDVLIGPSIAPNSKAVIEVVAESKTPMIKLSQGPTVISPADAKRRWVFNVPANTDVYTTAAINHMVRHGVKTVSVIAVDDAYGENCVEAYKRFADAAGIKTLTIEKYKRTDTSTTAQVLKAMQGNPDAVFIASAGTPAALPHVGLVERGYKGKIYQSGGAAVAEFLKVGGKALNGSFIIASPVLAAEQFPDNYPGKKETMEFVKAHEAKYGPPSFFASLSWNAVKLVEAAVPKALKVAKPGTEQFRAALRDALEGTKGLRAAGAVFTMTSTDHSGIDNLGRCVLRVEDGKWKLEEHAEFK